MAKKPLAPSVKTGQLTKTMQLAHIRLKQDQLGNDISMRNVTPAEVLLLISDHQKNAGGNPVTIVEITKDDAEEDQIESLEADVVRITKTIEDLDKDEITPEVRTVRGNNLQQQLDSIRDRLGRLKHLQARRKYSPTQEAERLISKYGSTRVKAAFPGAIPQLPQDFEEASKAGIGHQPPESSRLFTVGDTGH